MDIPKSELNRVLNPDEAHQYYEDGSRRWRKPHHNKRIAPSGLDTDSMDFRGVRAALSVTGTLPSREIDSEGQKAPRPLEVTRKHYQLGLTAIQEAGLLPLDDRFVEGYTRWADAVIEDELKFSEPVDTSVSTGQ